MIGAVFEEDSHQNEAEFTEKRNKNGNEREVRSKIIKLYFIGSDLYALLKFGNDTLRPDYLAEALQKTYASNHVNILKEEVFFLDGLSVEEYLEKLKCQ